MKKVILIAVAVLGALTVSSCRKETEKIIERVEVQKGNQILSGMGAPSENLGNIGDYYLDLSNTNLYGAKTAQGWGTPISLKGIQGDKGDTGVKGDKGDTGAKGDKGDTGAKGDKGDTGAKGDKGDTGAKGDKGDTGAKGDKGDTGAKGDKGDAGAKGDKGDTGAKGDKGDAGTKGNGQNVGQKGDKGEQGVAGKDGTKIYAGVGAPTNIGKAGDWYIDTLNKRLYGPKLEGTWGTSYIELGSTLPSVPIRTTDYELSADKKTLLKWKNERTTYIDMNSNEELKEVKYIDKNAFSLFARNLISIVLGDKIERIGKNAFAGCEKIISVTLPNTLYTIEERAFFGCKSLQKINLPNNLKKIEDEAFLLCEDLMSITIPNGLTYIGSAFQNSAITSITVPNNVTKISLIDCVHLKSATLPNTITEFRATRCSSLVSFIIPNSTDKILDSAFEDCFSLKSVVFHKNVKSIEKNAFYGCNSLTSITLPPSITKIIGRSFVNCEKLETITFEGTNPPILRDYPFDTRYLKNIYVPEGSEEKYKKAEGWSDYINFIKVKD